MAEAPTRRSVIAGLSLSVGAISSCRTSAGGTDPIAAIELRHGGRLGVFAVDIGSGRTLAHRADERFLMCSTFKGLLAAAVLAGVDAGSEHLDRMVSQGAQDLVFTSPVTEANLERGAMSVAALCSATLEESDNTAAILLMRSVDGPAGLANFLRSLDDTVGPLRARLQSVQRRTRHHDTSGDHRRSPEYPLGDVLSVASRARLESGMVACRPGLNRIRAALPAGWAAGDRPGTNVQEETNDYAIVRPPGRAPLLVAAYLDAPKLDMRAREAVLHEVGQVFVQWADDGVR